MTSSHFPDRGTGRRRPRRTRPAPAMRLLRAHDPGDLLAFVPLALGFVPEESIVVLALGRRGPHARVDLPHGPHQAAALGDELARTFLRHGVDRVALIAFSSVAEACWGSIDLIARVLAGHGFRVAEPFVAEPDRWYAHPTATPQPYDPVAHRFRTEAVVDGLVIHASRAQVAEQVAADPGLQADLAHRLPDHLHETSSVSGQGRWSRLRERIEHSATTAADLLDALVLAGDDDTLDLLWPEVTRAEGGAHRDFWAWALTGAPPDRVLAVAGLVGYLGWLTGQGALAWCALDRAERMPCDTGTTPGARALLECVRELVSGAVPPPVEAESQPG